MLVRIEPDESGRPLEAGLPERLQEPLAVLHLPPDGLDGLAHRFDAHIRLLGPGVGPVVVLLHERGEEATVFRRLQNLGVVLGGDDPEPRVPHEREDHVRREGALAHDGLIDTVLPQLLHDSGSLGPREPRPDHIDLIRLELTDVGREIGGAERRKHLLDHLPSGLRERLDERLGLLPARGEIRRDGDGLLVPELRGDVVAEHQRLLRVVVADAEDVRALLRQRHVVRARGRDHQRDTFLMDVVAHGVGLVAADDPDDGMDPVQLHQLSDLGQRHVRLRLSVLHLHLHRASGKPAPDLVEVEEDPLAVVLTVDRERPREG